MFDSPIVLARFGQSRLPGRTFSSYRPSKRIRQLAGTLVEAELVGQNPPRRKSLNENALWNETL
jgi:hypothetical protein